MNAIVIKMKKTGVAAVLTKRNSTRNATNTRVDRRWSTTEALLVRDDLMISKNRKISEITISKSPSDSENTPPDIMFIEKKFASKGEAPPSAMKSE